METMLQKNIRPSAKLGNRLIDLQHICQQCNKSFKAKFVCKTKPMPKYCSYECSNKAQDKKVFINCAGCEKEIVRKQYRLIKNEKQYCSIACWHPPLIINCDYCKEEFKRTPAKKNETNFCSRDCMGNWQSENKTGENSNSWLGGWEKYYGGNWKKQKTLAKKRDDYTCQVCGKAEGETTHHVHHIKAFRHFGKENYLEANELKNLMTVCPPCHGSIEPRLHIHKELLIEAQISPRH